MSDQYGPYRVGSRHRSLVLGFVTFVTAGTNPSVVSDVAGLLVATGTKVTHDSTGTFTLHLRDDYNAIFPLVAVENATDDNDVKLESTSVTAGANTVTVRCEDSGVANDLTGSTVRVVLLLSLSDDA